MPKALDLTNETFGYLTVISRANNYRGRTTWNCKCKCGRESVVTTQLLRRKKTQSCGCLHQTQLIKRNTKHGLLSDGKPRLYKLYTRMRERCNSPTCKSFKDYGGRGIKISPEFNRYEAFYAWAIHTGYTEGLTIERTNVNGNYSPSNCTWVPLSEQSRNKRNSKWTPDTVSIARTLKLYTTLTNKEIANQLNVAPHNVKSLSSTWLDIGPLPI